MGEHVAADSYTPTQRTRYRERLQRDLESFDRHLQRATFVAQGTIGLELELNLVDRHMQPAPVAARVLRELDSEYQSEIGACNVELNLPPGPIAGDGLARMEAELTRRIQAVREAAATADAQVAGIGTLPSLTPSYLQSPQWMTDENRYRALNNAVMQTRGELIRIDIEREESVHQEFESIAPESACTSMQLHLQVAPDRFANAWNASQAIAGVQAAIGANSPLYTGQRLWHESRIPLFAQSIDTRTDELRLQGVRPRVWFGERWITSVFDLFEENVRYFSPLLPEDRSTAGTPVMDGESPALHYLNLHNGTVWRWNRPIYDPSLEHAHIRVENRLLPAGPTPVDMIADAAFFYGLVKFFGSQNRPVWSRLSFAEARENFFAGARDGLDAALVWPVIGRVPVTELVREHLLEAAHAGLTSLDVDPTLIDRFLGVIEGRVSRRQNGATWQLDALAAVENAAVKGAAVEGTAVTGAAVTGAALPHSREPGTPDRAQAVRTVLEHYVAHQASGEPVHTWPGIEPTREDQP